MSLQENTTNLRKILNSVKKLPPAGGVELPTLFAPTIVLNSVSSELTITDNRNGDFEVLYNLYANDEFVTTLSSKTAMLNEYIEHTETIDIKVQAVGTNFNSSGYAVVEWKYVNLQGTAGLVYELSRDGTYAICKSIGDAVETDIEIASIYEGVPVELIETSAFQMTNIKSAVIPDTITRISSWAFECCTSLKSVVMGSGMAAIDMAVFRGCSSLKRVDFSSHTTVPQLGANNVFDDTPSTLQIKVPANLIDSWKTATNWSNYAKKIVTEFTNTL